MLSVQVRGDLLEAIRKLRKKISKDGYRAQLKLREISKPSDREKCKKKKAERRRTRRERRRWQRLERGIRDASKF